MNWLIKKTNTVMGETIKGKKAGCSYPNNKGHFSYWDRARDLGSLVLRPKAKPDSLTSLPSESRKFM